MPTKTATTPSSSCSRSGWTRSTGPILKSFRKLRSRTSLTASPPSWCTTSETRPRCFWARQSYEICIIFYFAIPGLFFSILRPFNNFSQPDFKSFNKKNYAYIYCLEKFRNYLVIFMQQGQFYCFLKAKIGQNIWPLWQVYPML